MFDRDMIPASPSGDDHLIDISFDRLLRTIEGQHIEQ
jgi:hypothetical protein